METTIKLELNAQMINVILAGLGKLPLETSIDTCLIVRQQVDRQVTQQQAVNRQEQSVPVETIQTPSGLTG